jgi:uncharacterized membrane protein YfcA
VSLYLPIAEISLNLWVLLGLGGAVGVLAGLFGIGGGFILTPVLIVMGVPPGVAVGTGAAQVVASSVSGALAHWRRGNVDPKLGAYLIVGGLIGAVIGVTLQQALRAIGQLDSFISITYAVVLGVVGSLMAIESMRVIRGRAYGRAPSGRRAGQHTDIERLPFKARFPISKIYISVLPPLIIGAFVGLLTAIMGVGGGFLLIPALIYLLRLPTRIAMGTSAFQIIFVTAVTTVLQATANHTVDLLLALPLMLGGVAGAQLGVRLGERLPAEQLRFLLAALVLLVAGRMAADLVRSPADLYALEAVD